jgi:predicted transcriptional regulator
MATLANVAATKNGMSSEDNSEDFFISTLRPEFNIICSNPVRACITHIFIKSKDLNHTMRVEEISHKVGKRHSVVIYHLEQLAKWKIVKVVKAQKYGGSEKRTIWGLNMDLPELVKEIYSHMLKFFFTQKELDKMCNINKNARNRRQPA